MPLYFFSSHRWHDGSKQPQGYRLAGNAAARNDALTLAQDFKHGALMPNWDWTGWFVTIVDQHGHKLDEPPIADV